MQPTGPNTPVLRRQNKAAVTRLLAAFSAGDTKTVSALAAAPAAAASGIALLNERISLFHDQFPDLRFEQESITAEADVVVVRWKITGTNTGKVFGRPPSGKKISHHGTDLFRFKEGKLVEHAQHVDLYRLYDKLGLLDAEMRRTIRERLAQQEAVETVHEPAAVAKLAAQLTVTPALAANKTAVDGVRTAFNSAGISNVRGLAAADSASLDSFISADCVDQSSKFMGSDAALAQAGAKAQPARPEDLVQTNSLRGLEGVKRQIKTFHEQFPDVSFADLGMVAEKDMVVLRWNMSGTNKGKIFGRPPTGKKVSYRGLEYLRVSGGKIVEHSDAADPFALLDKLDLLDDEMLQFLSKAGLRTYAGSA
jgi:predicted ester cyclase